MNAIKHWWANHVQKTMASLLILIDGINLAALELYHQDVVKLFGPTHGESVFSAIRIGLAAIIGIRAAKRKTVTPLPAPVPEATR